LPILAAVFLCALLVAVPLYLWRRPRAVPDVSVADASAPEDAVVDAALPPPSAAEAGSSGGIKLSDPRILECRDAKKTPTEQCDTLPQIAKSLADSIVGAKDCVPAAAGPGSITYVAEVSFSKHHPPLTVSLPKDGRSYKGMKAIGGCAASVRAAMSALSLEGMEHAHARYKIAIVATYPARTPTEGKAL
jgi:hypothetical protein